MKVRNGFISNSSSSSFIVCGFSSDDSREVCNILEKKFKEEDPCISDIDVRWKTTSYLEKCGIDYYYGTKEIGCILDEGSREEFNESLKRAENALKKFDEDHHTDFAKNHKIYSVYEAD